MRSSQLLTAAALLLLASGARAQAPEADLAPGEGDALVRAHCGACHSLNLVTQNRGDAAHWKKLIEWMQADHNLWDLGPAEETILSYLSTHYGAPDLVPRRPALVTQWHGVKEEQ